MKGTNPGKLKAICCLSAIVSSAMTPAFGQERQGPRAPLLEEVIVTAEHREASIQDTQISMTAFSEEMIRELGISNAEDISQFTPNVTLTQIGGGRAGYTVNMRGVRQGESYITFDPAVGMYLDGVLIAKNTGSLLDVVDIERMEVLRGPQGTLYGRNTIGGAINIITKKPEDELGGRLMATLGSENQRDFRGVLNVPLTGAESALGGLAMRAAVGSIKRDGLYRNDDPDSPYDEMDTRDRDIATVHLLWTPTPDLDVMYSYDRTHMDELPQAGFITFANPNFPISAAAQPEVVEHDKRPTSGYFDGTYIKKLDVDGHALNISYDVSNNLMFTSITAHREMSNMSVGGGGQVFIVATDDIQQNKTVTQEFRLVGTGMDGKLSYSLGTYFLNEKGSLDAGVTLGAFGGLRLPTVGDYENEAWAVYGQGTYDFAERWHLTAGLRYTREDREMSKVGIGTTSGDFDDVSPTVSLGYDWNDGAMTYAKVSRGFQSGGFNIRDTNPAIFKEGFDEEYLTAYELGLKSVFGEGRYRLNAAAYFSDYDDKQVSVLQGVSQNVLSNAGVVEIYGMELEFLAQLTDNVAVGFDYGHIKPEYKKWESGGRDLTDSYFTYTPQNSSHSYITYDVPNITFGRLTARIDYSYQGAVRFLSNNPEINSEDSYGLWNARITLSELAGPGDSSLRVSLWGKNLLDEVYWNYGVSIYDQPIAGIATNIYGEQRTIGVDISAEF